MQNVPFAYLLSRARILKKAGASRTISRLILNRIITHGLSITPDYRLH